jgi:hypothetical protein
MVDGGCMMEDGSCVIFRNRLHFKNIKNFVKYISPVINLND